MQFYDLVYVQHQVLSRILVHQCDEAVFGQNRPIFVYNHLSTVEPFELPGPFVEVDVADLMWTQSPKTLDVYRQRYDARFAHAICVPNPAPASFEPSSDWNRPRRLEGILSVSNHLPAELIEAFSILQANGLRVTKIGGHGNNRRLSSADVHQNDCVVTIGKSAQYAIRARKPVYCYDHFGGPGWLTEENFQQTSYRNFSGLNDSRRRSPEEIVSDVVEGYAAAAGYASSRDAQTISSYVLENHIENLVQQVREHKNQAKPLFVERYMPCDRVATRARWAHEAQIYTLIDREYGFNRDRNI